MKYLITFIIIAMCIYSCDTSKTAMENGNTGVQNDTIRIANDSLQYEVIIIEPGFDSWLPMQKPKSFYSLRFLEDENNSYVNEYNRRVIDNRYNSNIYPHQINYDRNIHYGMDVNYLLYNYFQFFEITYKQDLR